MARTEVTGSQIKDGTVSLTADVVGILPVANGGSGSSTLALNNVLLGNGTGALQAVAPGTTGNVLTSNGTSWVSSPNAGGGGDVTLTGTQTLTNKTLTNPTINTPAINNATALSVGNSTSAPAATPANINLGGTYGSTTAGSGSNQKVILYDGGGTVAARSGLGISASTQEYTVPTSWAHRFYVAGTERLTVTGSAVQVGGVDVVTTTGAQTLTNKSLTSPTITGTPVANFAVTRQVVGKGKFLPGTVIDPSPIGQGDGSISIGLHNDLAYLIERGGTGTITQNGTSIDASGLSALFKGSGLHISAAAVTDVFVIEVTKPPTHPYGAFWQVYQTGINFRAGFVARSVKIEHRVNGVWTTSYDVTGDAEGVHYVKAGAAAPYVDAFRFTLTDFQGAGANLCRIQNIWSIGTTANPAFSSAATNFLPRSGGDLFGSAASAPSLQAAGGDANIPLNLYSKGTGAVVLRGTNGISLLANTAAASSVNYVQATGNVTGSRPYLQAGGSDTNIDLDLFGKGTGIVRAGGVPVVTTTGTQSLTNKTLTSPSITTPTGIVKGDVGLGNVDNTSDANKPVSTATSTALSGKEPTITAGTTAQYYRGDKSFQTLNQDAVPSGTTNKVFTATQETKLAGVATGATANSTDATLLARTNHTGTQLAATISDFSTAVTGVTGTKGAANGYASLDSGGKVPVAQLPNSIMEYQGTWNASTNTPTLANGTGSAGDVYRVSVAGTALSLTFEVGDYVIYNGSTWEKSDTTDAVASVAGRTGNVVLTKTDVGLGNVDNTSDDTKNAATATLTNKTLTNPKIANIYDPTQSKPVLDMASQVNSVNRVGVIATVTGVAPYLTATGTDTNVDLNLRGQGTGVVQANGIPVVTTTGTQTLTNKTISGASNTITNLPASATPLASRLVATTSVAVANNWTKVATFAPGSNPYYAHTLNLRFVAYGSPSSAVVGIFMGNTTSGTNPSVSVRMTERTGSFANDFVKVISGAYGTDSEVWITWPGNGTPINVYEIGKYDNFGTVTYHGSGAWQAEPVGAVNNVKTAGVEIGITKADVGLGNVDNTSTTTISQSLRANRNLNGGGTFTVDASSNVKWSNRMMVISNGRGTNFATDGYFTIDCPVTGTVTGVGGAANKTATAAGIPLAAYEALYYILPIGSGWSSVAANFRVALYTGNLNIPHDWVLICVRSDSNVFTFNNGITLRPGESLNCITQDTAATVNTLVRRDASGNFSAGTITATLSGNATSATSANTATTATYVTTGTADNASSNVNFRVMRNSNTTTFNDGMYIGYGNSNSGPTRLFGGGDTANPVTISAGGQLSASGNILSAGVTVPTISSSSTLTNKTIALGSNTVSGTLAQFNTAVTDADLVSLAGTETLTNKTIQLPRPDSIYSTDGSLVNTFYIGNSDSGRFPYFSPVPKYLWHDILRFSRFTGAPTYETYDGTAWTSQTLNTNILSGKEATAYPLTNGTTTTGARWTWNSVNLSYSYLRWWVIGLGYVGATTPINSFLVESSANGTTWTTRHTSTVTSQAAPVWLYATDHGADPYLRLTIVTTSAQGINLSGIKGLSSRWANQGGGVEYEFPYDWDGSRNITTLANLTVGIPGTSAGSAVTIDATQTLTNKTLTSPVINGTLTGTGVATAATPSTLALRDANANLAAKNFVNAVNSTATAAGTTTLTIASGGTQVFTGTTTQTVLLPTTGIVQGQQYTFINNSTGAVTVQPSGGVGTVTTMLGGGWVAIVTATADAPTTTAHWTSMQVAAGTQGVFPASGSVTSTTNAVTLTNKTIALGSNTVSGTLAQFNTAVTDADLVSLAGTETLTNKRITPRVVSVASSATPAINTDNGDVFNLTSLATNVTSMTTSLTGTPIDGQRMTIRVKSAAAQTITWGASFASSGAAMLPTTTVAGATHRLDFLWDAADSDWVCVGSFHKTYSSPPTRMGSGITVNRTATGLASLSPGENIFPLGWFGNVVRSTDDLTYDTSGTNTGKVTVSVEGWYQCTLSCAAGLASANGGSLYSILWTGSGAGARSVAFYGGQSRYNAAGGTAPSLNGSFIIYLKAGDYVEPGYYSNVAVSNTLGNTSSDFTSKTTWFSVALINRSHS